MQKILNLLVKYSIYALVFLLPLFFLPFNYEAFEFNKQYLLFFLTTFAGISWLIKMVVFDKEVRFRKTPLDLFILAFLLIAVLSAVFSIDKTSSLYGFYGRFSDGLIGLLSCGILYFLITNNAGVGEDKKIVSAGGMIKALLWSSAVIIVSAYLSVFGVFAKLGELISLPSILSQSTFNPVSGSLEGLSIFLAVLISVIVGLLATSKSISKLAKIGKWLLLALSFALLLIIDSAASWIIIISAMVIFVGFSLWRRIFKENVNNLLVPVLLIITASILIPVSLPNIVFGEESNLANLPKEQVLNQEISWKIGWDSATENVKNGFLGSGIGTFYNDFTKNKPIEINNSWLWQIRFDRAGNHFAEMLATLGFAGLVSYLLVIGLFLVTGCLLMARISNISEAHPLQMPLFLGFIALLAAQFVYYQNTALSFAFWAVLGLSMAVWKKPIKEKAVSFSDFPELSLILSTVVIILGVAVLSLYFFGVKFYMADVNYGKAIGLLGQERIDYMTKAVKLNPYLPQYRMALSRTYLYEAIQELQKSEEDQDQNRAQAMVSSAINEAKVVTEMQKDRVTSWENLGVVYREIIGVAQGAADWGIDSFEKALTYEPTNPVLYTEIGKLYIAKTDGEKAKEYFFKAKEVKPDYAEATIQLALLLESEEVTEEAILELESLVTNNPLTTDGRFQLGRLYFNSNRIDEAIEQFKIVVLLVPDHSNAHYSLGIAYASQGETDLALLEFEKVLELNPDNQDVIQKIEDLKGESEE
jgi:tetratricopeptide (TPR) repeat protein